MVAWHFPKVAIPFVLLCVVVVGSARRSRRSTSPCTSFCKRVEDAEGGEAVVCQNLCRDQKTKPSQPGPFQSHRPRAQDDDTSNIATFPEAQDQTSIQIPGDETMDTLLIGSEALDEMSLTSKEHGRSPWRPTNDKARFPRRFPAPFYVQPQSNDLTIADGNEKQSPRRQKRSSGQSRRKRWSQLESESQWTPIPGPSYSSPDYSPSYSPSPSYNSYSPSPSYNSYSPSPSYNSYSPSYSNGGYRPSNSYNSYSPSYSSPSPSGEWGGVLGGLVQSVLNIFSGGSSNSNSNSNSNYNSNNNYNGGNTQSNYVNPSLVEKTRTKRKEPYFDENNGTPERREEIRKLYREFDDTHDCERRYSKWYCVPNDPNWTPPPGIPVYTKEKGPYYPPEPKDKYPLATYASGYGHDTHAAPPAMTPPYLATYAKNHGNYVPKDPTTGRKVPKRKRPIKKTPVDKKPRPSNIFDKYFKEVYN